MGTRTAIPALMAAADKGALQPAQISKNYLAGALALVIAAEGFDSVTDNGVVGPDGMSNEIVGSIRCALAGRDYCLHASMMALTYCGFW